MVVVVVAVVVVGVVLEQRVEDERCDMSCEVRQTLGNGRPR